MTVTWLWTRVKDKLPEKHKLVLGWDVFYNQHHICSYDGDANDNGEPWLQCIRGGDDYNIQYWMPLPAGPNVQENDG